MAEFDEIDADDRPSRRRPRRLRAIALAVVIGTIVGMGGAVAVVAVVLRGQQLPQVTFDILNAAAERWAKNGPKDYDFDLELTGVNPGVAHIEVEAAK